MLEYLSRAAQTNGCCYLQGGGCHITGGWLGFYQFNDAVRDSGGLVEHGCLDAPSVFAAGGLAGDSYEDAGEWMRDIYPQYAHREYYADRSAPLDPALAVAYLDEAEQRPAWTPYSACAAIEGFDGEEHDQDDIVSAFQYLIDTGLVWQLQGFYGRTAKRLIDEGYCHA